MANVPGEGSPTFRQQELAGWQAKAAGYNLYGVKITSQIAEPLLDAVGLRSGMRLLDVACGPGFLTGAALARGARAVGVDITSAMVSEAKKRFPEAEFRLGDAEALEFDDGMFDAVVCAFGLGHLAQPDRAINEAFRVLRGGARYGFAWWCAPDKHEFFAALLEAIKTHGTLDVPLPPAPPMFRFSDAQECRRSLQQAGFVNPSVTDLALLHEPRSEQELIDFLYKSTVRTAMVLEAQAPQARARIEDAFRASARRFWHGEGYRIRWSAVIASATKP